MITAIGGIGVGEQILKALLLGGDYQLIGADIDPTCPQFALADTCLVLPPASDPTYLDELLATCLRHHVEALFVGSEAELRVLSPNRQRFVDAGIVVMLAPDEVITTCMDKPATAAFLELHGFATPLTWSADGAEQIDRFPVVVKPARNGGGSSDCYIAQSSDELQVLLSYLARRGADIMVQEYVGDPQSEYTVGVLHDLDGRFVNSIAVHRKLTNPLSVRQAVPNLTDRWDLGPKLVVSSGVSQGDVGPFPEVTATCERIAAELGARGPINVQCRLVNDEVVVFEINPRFSGTTSLRAMVGYNEPDLLLRQHLLGQRIPLRFPYDSATVLRSLREWHVPRDRGRGEPSGQATSLDAARPASVAPVGDRGAAGGR
jgi:carbamoyl-phosphate synthase large subunit